MSKKRKPRILRFRIPKKYFKGKGIVSPPPLLVRDLGDGGFPTPNPNVVVRDAKLVLAGLKRPLRDRDAEMRDEMRNRNIALRELYKKTIARLR